jgi:hypothetical protein
VQRARSVSVTVSLSSLCLSGSLLAYCDSHFSLLRAGFWPESAVPEILNAKVLCCLSLSLAGVVSESVLRGEDVFRPQDPLL